MPVHIFFAKKVGLQSGDGYDGATERHEFRPMHSRENLKSLVAGIEKWTAIYQAQGSLVSGIDPCWEKCPMKLPNFWKILRGEPYPVQGSDGQTTTYANFWQFLNHRRGKSFNIELPEDYRLPDIDTLQNTLANDPTDVRARMGLAAQRQTAGSFDEAYQEYLKAIAVLSNGPFIEDEAGRLAQRAFAHWMAARVLEEQGRDADARQHWQGCADDWRTAVPQEKYLRENPMYLEAMDKLQ